jgi:hypothetical protein
VSGFVCIAMQKLQPYKIVISVTELEPDAWIEQVSPAAHLLCFEGFREHAAIGVQFKRKLADIGIVADYGKAFIANPVDVVRAFLSIRDALIRARSVSKDNLQSEFDSVGIDEYTEEEDEGSLLYEMAKKYQPESVKAFNLFRQSAQSGYKPAFISVASAYLFGLGISKDIIAATNWATKLFTEDLEQFDSHSKLETGELFHSLAVAYENGSEQSLIDPQKAFNLNLQSSQLGYTPAYTAIANAYLTGEGVERDFIIALEWAMREIDVGIIYGYNHATTCFIKTGMKQQAEFLWKKCFNEQSIENIAVSCFRIYLNQITSRAISIDPEIRLSFKSLANCLSNYQQELGATLYDRQIAWLTANS